MGIFYENSASSDESRLKKVLISDKHFNPERVKRVIRSDMYAVLRDYADVSPESMQFDIEINSSGDYEFYLRATAKRMKIFGALPDEY